jgi:hypothetical protein
VIAGGQRALIWSGATIPTSGTWPQPRASISHPHAAIPPDGHRAGDPLTSQAGGAAQLGCSACGSQPEYASRQRRNVSRTSVGKAYSAPLARGVQCARSTPPGPRLGSSPCAKLGGSSSRAQAAKQAVLGTETHLDSSCLFQIRGKRDFTTEDTESTGKAKGY